MRDLVPSQIPFVLDRLVALVAAHITTHRVHVQDVLHGQINIITSTQLNQAFLPALN